VKCEKCGAGLRERTILSGDKQGRRYWVCNNYPKCTFRKLYAEQGESKTFKYHLEDGKFTIKGV
jgi:ssDNA-binding Zn-finger/Zn-ribbon topoisomerase 1